MPHQKKIIMLIIDTLMDSSLQAALKNGKAPALQFFIENGRYFSNLVSPFLLSLFTGLKRKKMDYSPDLFSYGAMHRLNPLKKNSFFLAKVWIQ